jgi:hypothetical protein
MDDEAREAMREEGYDPDTPQIDRLWLMPADVEGDRHWSASPVTLWDVEYVRADLLADLAAKLAAAEARAERAEASWRLAYSRLTRALAEPATDDRAALVELATWIEAAGLAPADEPPGPGVVPLPWGTTYSAIIRGAMEPAGPAKGGSDGE